MQKNFVSIDLETTGLLPKEDRIIEIGAVRYREGKEVSCFHSFVNPERSLAERITELTGICEEDLKGQPKFSEICDELLVFLGEDVLLAHHISFDYAFLKRAVIRTKGNRFAFDKSGIDSLKIARNCLSELESRTLSALCGYYKIPLLAHRAIEDARATAILYQKMAENFESKKSTVFEPYPLIYKVKKDSPATRLQKERLYRLLQLHKITAEYDIEGLTKSEASRYQDRILAEYGR